MIVNPLQTRSFARISRTSTIPKRNSLQRFVINRFDQDSSVWKLFLGGGFGFTDTTTVNKLKILKYPHPSLRQVNEEVTVFDDNLVQLCHDLLKMMYIADGIGLAAPQVGVNKRIMVFNEAGDSSKAELEMILINPTIIHKSQDVDIREEGCLSFPMIHGRVYRSISIEINYQDVNGNKLKKALSGFPARIFQHEYDHLDQVLFIDRIIEEDKAVSAKRLEKMIRRYGAAAAI